MTQFKVLQVLEETIFEIMAWIMLLPKTLLQIIFKPGEIIHYVNNEWQTKKPVDRYDEFLSPVFFWIFVAVLPLTYVLLSENEIRQDGFLAIFVENKIILGAGIASLLLMIYLAWIELVNDRPIRKSALQRVFHIQCYITSPAVLIITLVVRLTTTVKAFQGYLLASILFVIFYETFVMKSELKVGWKQAIWKAIQPLLIIGGIIGVIVVIGS